MRKVKCIILLTIIFFITGCSGGKGDNIENTEISKDAGIQLNEDDFNVLNSGGEIYVDESERVDKNEDSQDIVKEKQYTFPLETTEADYEIVTATYEQGKIKIQYPQVSGLADEEKQNAINELIREDLLKTQVDEVLEGLENVYCEDIYHLELKYEIKAQTAEILSILYTGNSLVETLYEGNYSSYYSNVIDALTLNMQDAKKLELTDFVDVDEELVKRIRACSDYTNATVETQQDKEDLQILIQNEYDEFIIKGLSKCWGPYQFCVTPDILIVSIGTARVGGDYILFTLQNDDSHE